MSAIQISFILRAPRYRIFDSSTDFQGLAVPNRRVAQALTSLSRSHLSGCPTLARFARVGVAILIRLEQGPLPQLHRIPPLPKTKGWGASNVLLMEERSRFSKAGPPADVFREVNRNGV